jgi:hypothetical protein
MTSHISNPFFWFYTEGVGVNYNCFASFPNQFKDDASLFLLVDFLVGTALAFSIGERL